MTKAKARPAAGNRKLEVSQFDYIPAGGAGQLLNLTERRVQQLAAEGVLPKDAAGHYRWPDVVTAYINHIKSSDDAPAREQKLRLECEKLTQQLDRGRVEIANEERQRLSEQIVNALEIVCDCYRALKIPKKYIDALGKAFDKATEKIRGMK
jgi:hypothetical protein